MSSTKVTKRLRIFAGPNGSGKSTIIDSIRKIKINGHPIDFGIYINADDIAHSLRKNDFSFFKYKLRNITRDDFICTIMDSGLIGENFNDKTFRKSFSISRNSKLTLNNKKYDEHMAQILAEYLRWKLLEEEKKISFETVFSHPSKLEFMKEAASR